MMVMVMVSGGIKEGIAEPRGSRPVLHPKGDPVVMLYIVCYYYDALWPLERRRDRCPQIQEPYFCGLFSSS